MVQVGPQRGRRVPENQGSFKLLQHIEGVTAAAAPIGQMLLATQGGATILARLLPDTALLATRTSLQNALLVALGRRSQLPAIRSVCTVYVELVRGVPLISVLFMASFMFPLFMPQGLTIDVLGQ